MQVMEDFLEKVVSKMRPKGRLSQNRKRWCKGPEATESPMRIKNRKALTQMAARTALQQSSMLVVSQLTPSSSS